MADDVEFCTPDGLEVRYSVHLEGGTSEVILRVRNPKSGEEHKNVLIPQPGAGGGAHASLDTPDWCLDAVRAVSVRVYPANPPPH